MFYILSEFFFQAGRSSLHLACRHGYGQIVQQLITADADVNAQTKVCCHGYGQIVQQGDSLKSTPPRQKFKIQLMTLF